MLKYAGVRQKGSHLLEVNEVIKTMPGHYQSSGEEYPRRMAVELVVHLDHGNEVGVGAIPLLVASFVSSATRPATETAN